MTAMPNCLCCGVDGATVKLVKLTVPELSAESLLSWQTHPVVAALYLLMNDSQAFVCDPCLTTIFRRDGFLNLSGLLWRIAHCVDQTKIVIGA